MTMVQGAKTSACTMGTFTLAQWFLPLPFTSVDPGPFPGPGPCIVFMVLVFQSLPNCLVLSLISFPPTSKTEMTSLSSLNKKGAIYPFDALSTIRGESHY